MKFVVCLLRVSINHASAAQYKPRTARNCRPGDTGVWVMKFDNYTVGSAIWLKPPRKLIKVSVCGHFGPWSLRSWGRSVYPFRSMVISVLGHFGPKDRTDLATSVLRKPKLSQCIAVILMDRSVPGTEVVKALRSLFTSVSGHFRLFWRSEVTRDRGDQGPKWM